jgi:hypothetical protein
MLRCLSTHNEHSFFSSSQAASSALTVMSCGAGTKGTD